MDARRRTWLIASVVGVVFPVLLTPLVASAGVNGDGDIDAVFASHGPVNPICLGDGSGGFACSDLAGTQRSAGVALGDLDGDENLDAVFSISGSAGTYPPSQVCLGNGSGGFVCSDLSDVGNARGGVALGDLNRDGNLDAVFATWHWAGSGPKGGDPNRVCLGDGSGAFVCRDVSSYTNVTQAVALGDVDGDGNLDAVFANYLPAMNRVCLGDGLGGFICGDAGSDLNVSQGVALGHVDGDGNIDAVFANSTWFAAQPASNRNRVCLGDGSGGFTCGDVSSDSADTAGVALGDVDLDGNLDAVFASGSQRNRVCLGDGSAGFVCSDVSSDTNSTQGVALGDVDRDGDLDAVFAGTQNRLCLGDGAGGFVCSDVDVSDDSDFSSGVALTPSRVERLAGSNRFATAAAISSSEFDAGVPAAYVTTGGNFPDALAGGPVAALNGGPMLLLSSIPGATAAELTRLQPQKIVILGSTGLVSAGDAAALAAFTAGPVERLAGANRFATAAAISASEFSPGVPVAYVATGANFPDALAGGPVAALNGGPILLVNADSIPAATALELVRLQAQKIVILGGTGVVSDTVATQLAFLTTGAVERLAGANRFATAAAISASQFSPGVDVVYVATGANFPDALAGGPVAGINSGPILLVNQDSIPRETAAELTRLAPKEIVILGGTGVVSIAVETQLAAFIG